MDWFWLLYFQTQPTMYKLKILLASVLLLATTSLTAQESEPDKKDSLKIPGSILRIGYSPVSLSQGAQLSPGLTIDFEKPLSARLTVGASLYRDFGGNGLSYDQLEWRTRQYNDIRTSLSFSLNYYFKRHAYDGFYLSYRVNNAVAQVKTAADWSPFVGMQGTTSNRVISNPRRGLYLGYRKVFKNGMFIDGSAGVAPYNGRDYNLGLLGNDWLDMKLTIGWQLDWNKLKKKNKR